MTDPSYIDKYQIIRRLGGGNFGDVYHAFDRALQVEKAIKVLRTSDPAKLADDLREAQVLAGCVHKHIVQINEANIFPVVGDQQVVLDLEYVAEGSLEGAIASRWLSLHAAVSYVRGALLGLEHAHSQGLLHRDIKPGNILLAPNCAKLSDFGLATQTGPGPYGSGRGYTTHLPPEFFSNQTTSIQTDVYAAGITLFRAVNNISDWRAVVGAIPNGRQHIEQGSLVKKIGYSAHVPDPLKRIVNKACAADPAKRYQNAAAFGQKLDALRFDIDWVRVSDAEWVGTRGNDSFSISIQGGKNEVVVKKNRRRVNQQCCLCGSMAQALDALEMYVRDTSLA